MSKRIAIVGAGTGGLHLGLYLQQKGGQSTIFTDKKIADYPNLRLAKHRRSQRGHGRA
jgi:2-polyprenyl-6-methoxyphenol hydroxylase-like FAD-dependent oxidoreductase